MYATSRSGEAGQAGTCCSCGTGTAGGEALRPDAASLTGVLGVVRQQRQPCRGVVDGACSSATTGRSAVWGDNATG